jgi:hypothetical protein
MRYQLAGVLAQVKHLRKAQALESGMAQDWVFPLERALERAVEELQLAEQEHPQLPLHHLQQQASEYPRLSEYPRSSSEYPKEQ